MTTAATSNKALVLEAFDLVFNTRDYDAAEEFWSESYIQHSAAARNLLSLVRHSASALEAERRSESGRDRAG